MENNDKKYDNNNNGILFNQNNGSLEGNITLNDVKYKMRTIPIDDESADLVIHLPLILGLPILAIVLLLLCYHEEMQEIDTTIL